MRTLYPDLRPFDEQLLARDGGHTIYIERYGNPDGHPILIFHDGPGGGMDPVQHRMLDAERFQMICFDQRGCGRSRAARSLQNNDPDALVADAAAIAEHFKLSAHLVWGHGWGAWLALRYALAETGRLDGLVLSALTLPTLSSVKWAFAEGARCFFPDAWREFAGTDADRDTFEILAHYREQLEADNELVRMQAARRWARWITRVHSVHPSKEQSDRIQHPHVALPLARLSCHFYEQSESLPGLPEAAEIERLKDLPLILVHGRFDVVSPLRIGDRLQRQWAGSELFIVRDGSHSLYDPAFGDATIRALATMLDRVNGQEGPIVE